VKARDDSLVAIVAALPEELNGVARRATGLRAEHRGEIRGRVGRLGGTRVVLVVTGDGARNARWGLGRVLAAFEPGRCLVAGLAGALTTDLQVGDVVAARRILSTAGEAPAPDADWLARAARSLPVATVFSAERIAHTVQGKADLRQHLQGEGPAVVDLESATFAGVAAAAGTPYVVLRAVSDLAGEALPFDFERFRDERGSVSRARVARFAALRPRAAARLLDLRRRVELCAYRLADAVEEALAA
jgi:adenosylhomocysteine nucleosidase